MDRIAEIKSGMAEAVAADVATGLAKDAAKVITVLRELDVDERTIAACVAAFCSDIEVRAALVIVIEARHRLGLTARRQEAMLAELQPHDQGQQREYVTGALAGTLSERKCFDCALKLIAQQIARPT
jgi:hypothetical protein